MVLAIKEIFAQDTTPTIPKSRKVTTTRLLTVPEFLAEMKDEAVKERLLKEKEEAKKRKLIEKERKRRNKKLQKIKRMKKNQLRRSQLRKQTVKKSAKKKRRVEVEVENDSNADDPLAASDSEIEELCGICNKSFQKNFNGDRWIKCINCGQWFHFDCVDNADNVSEFYCSQCFEQ